MGRFLKKRLKRNELLYNLMRDETVEVKLSRKDIRELAKICIPV
jgi:hypothetical protein